MFGTNGTNLVEIELNELKFNSVKIIFINALCLRNIYYHFGQFDMFIFFIFNCQKKKSKQETKVPNYY